MVQIIPVLNDSLAAVINIAVGNVSPNLSSKNKEINQTALDIIDALMEHLGKLCSRYTAYLFAVISVCYSTF